jgi:DNA (cytosine-5)-methyltransferase 1
VKVVDLFCGAGGATKGLQRAGFHVTGVDIRPQPRYCGDVFHQADAMTFNLEGFDFIWASPPCQAYSISRSRPRQAKEYPMLIEPVRARLIASAKAYVIENVPGAPLLQPFLLCGCAFGLGVRCEDGTFRPLRRHRLFESNIFMLGTGCVCGNAEKCGVYGNGGGFQNRFSDTRKGYKGNRVEMLAAMGIDWMTIAEVSEAIPPAYSEFIGRQILGTSNV